MRLLAGSLLLCGALWLGACGGPAPARLPKDALLQAQAHLRQGEFDQAQQVAEALTQRHPDFGPGWRVLGEVAARRRLPEAARHFERALSLIPGDGQTRFLLGKFWLETGDYNQAVLTIQDFARYAPLDARVEELRALLAQARGDSRAAAEHYDKAGQLSLEDPVTLKRQAAVARFLAGEYEAAAQAFREVLTEQPDDFEALYHLGEILFRANDMPAARGMFEKARMVRPEHTGVLIYLGKVAYNEQDHAGAADYFRLAHETDPADLGAALSYSTILHQQTRTAEAVDVLKRCVAENPGQLEAARQLVAVLFILERWEEALPPLRELVAAEPESLPLALQLGYALHNAGQEEQAYANYEELTRRFPREAEVRYSYAVALSDRDRCIEALDQLAYAVNLRPHYPEAHALRGQCHYELGQFPEAVAAFDTALAQSPPVAEVFPDFKQLHQSAKRRALATE